MAVVPGASPVKVRVLISELVALEIGVKAGTSGVRINELQFEVSWEPFLITVSVRFSS